jgi:hypothetical protein
MTGCLLPMSATAEPWAAPGDPWLRHDVQVLADAGLIRAPVLSWPLPWADIAAGLPDAATSRLTPVQQSAAARVAQRAAQEMRRDSARLGFELAGAHQPDPLRTFEDTPREEGEAALVVDWLGDRFAWKLAGRVVADSGDGQTFRPDGSYVAASLGNWMLGAGYRDRWWGPGWQGSLILSSNARPLPAISLDRNESRPFDWPVLRWLGPWRFNTFMGQLEGDRDYPHALLFGMRAEARPLPSLQVAVSRTAQWCGAGRPCDLATFGDLLVGNDNDQALEDQPGNQLAGFDLRWSWPGGGLPLAIYAQAIGEDEAGFMPSKYLGLFGFEAWGDWSGRSWRVLAEYSDTACDFHAAPPEFGCAYTNSIYTTGYRYRGRVQGHPMDADGESVGLGATLLGLDGVRWHVTARNVKLNRAGAAAGHSLTASPARVRDLEVVRDQPFTWGNITVSLGYAAVDARADDGLEEGLRGFLTLSHGIQ